MSQPSFSYQFESERTLEEVWALLTDLNFWHQCWHGLCHSLTLSGPLRLGSRGMLVLNDGHQWELLVNNLDPTREITFQLTSMKGKISLVYELEKAEKLHISTTIRLDEFNIDTQDLVSTLINPIITKHLHQFQTLLTDAAPTKKAEQATSDSTAVLDVQAGFRLWQLANLWQSKVRAVLKPFQLTPTQWLLLYALVRLEKSPEPITPSTLAEALELNAVLVSDVIKALVKKHLVHKIKILPDKRSFVISATADGKITAVEAHMAVVQADKKFFAAEPLSSIYKILAKQSN